MRRLRRLYKDIRSNIFAVPGRLIASAFILALFIVPLILQDAYLLRMITLANIFAIFAASWDVLSGFTRQVNLGHAAFFGISAYVAALINLRLHLEPLFCIAVGSVGAVLMGLVVGFPALRLRGIYLSLTTLAFPVILNGIVVALADITGGELGLYGVAPLLKSNISLYYVSLVLMVASALAMWKLTDAKSSIVRTGIRFLAIGEDEIAARSAGINTPRYKLLAFCVSAFFAGLAGGIYVHAIRVAGPSMFDLFFSFQPVIWTIFGGIGTIGGAITGVYVLYPLSEVLRMTPEIRMIVFAFLVAIVLLFMPEGIVTWLRDRVLEEECPRCKIVNSKRRTFCRGCGAPLRLSQAEMSQS